MELENGAHPAGCAPSLIFDSAPLGSPGPQQQPQPLLLPQLFPPQQQHRMMIRTMIHRQPPPPKPLLQHPINEVPPVMKFWAGCRRAQPILCQVRERVTAGCQKRKTQRKTRAGHAGTIRLSKGCGVLNGAVRLWERPVCPIWITDRGCQTSSGWWPPPPGWPDRWAAASPHPRAR